MRDAAHEQQLTVMRQSLTASKVYLLPCLRLPSVPCPALGQQSNCCPGGSATDDEASWVPAQPHAYPGKWYFFISYV